MRIDDIYDQGAEGARGGAVEEARDEQKPNDNDNDEPSVSSHLCFHSQPDSCAFFHRQTMLSSKVGPINEVIVTCNGNTFTCIPSGAGETSTQVWILKNI